MECPASSATVVANGSGTSPAPIHVGSVVHGFDADEAGLVVDSVDDAVASAAAGVPAGEFEVQRPPDTMRVIGKRAIHELCDRGCHLLRQPLQVALCCR